jgi:hypothetical protein
MTARSARGLGRVKTEKAKQRLEGSSSLWALVEENAQFPVTDPTSEKFILAIVLLGAFLHGQGHHRPIGTYPRQVCSTTYSGRAEARL